jgi:hypothetical protein
MDGIDTKMREDGLSAIEAFWMRRLMNFIIMAIQL